MEPLYTFDRAGMEALARDHRRLQHQVQNLRQDPGASQVRGAPVGGYLVKTPSAGLAAENAGAPGQGRCEVYGVRGGGIAELGSRRWIKNAGAELPGDTLVPVIRDGSGDLWATSIPTSIPPAHFVDATVIHRAAAVGAAWTVNEVRATYDAWLVFNAYTADLAAAGVEYLFFSPVTNPFTQFNDPLIRFLNAGTWLVQAEWTIVASPMNNWGSPLPYGISVQNTGPASAGAAHTHTENAFSSQWCNGIAHFNFRPNSSTAWASVDYPRLFGRVTVPHNGAALQGTNYAQSSAMGLVNVSAGAEMKIELGCGAGTGGGQPGYVIGQFGLKLQFLGGLLPASNAYNCFGVTPTATALPLRAAHANF